MPGPVSLLRPVPPLPRALRRQARDRAGDRGLPDVLARHRLLPRHPRPVQRGAGHPGADQDLRRDRDGEAAEALHAPPLPGGDPHGEGEACCCPRDVP